MRESHKAASAIDFCLCKNLNYFLLGSSSYFLPYTYTTLKARAKQQPVPFWATAIVSLAFHCWCHRFATTINTWEPAFDSVVLLLNCPNDRNHTQDFNTQNNEHTLEILALSMLRAPLIITNITVIMKRKGTLPSRFLLLEPPASVHINTGVLVLWAGHQWHQTEGSIPCFDGHQKCGSIHWRKKKRVVVL